MRICSDTSVLPNETAHDQPRLATREHENSLRHAFYGTNPELLCFQHWHLRGQRISERTHRRPTSAPHFHMHFFETKCHDQGIWPPPMMKMRGSQQPPRGVAWKRVGENVLPNEPRSPLCSTGAPTVAAYFPKNQEALYFQPQPTTPPANFLRTADQPAPPLPHAFIPNEPKGPLFSTPPPHATSPIAPNKPNDEQTTTNDERRGHGPLYATFLLSCAPSRWWSSATPTPLKCAS